VHGVGNINSRRDTGLGFATAGYNARLDGAISEISYYWSKDQYRIVPKGAFEYVRAQDRIAAGVRRASIPVMATGATVERVRRAGWRRGRALLDLRPEDSRHLGLWQVRRTTWCRISPTSPSASAARASLSRASAKASTERMPAHRLRSAEQHRALYINYDAKFRAASQSHQGTVGRAFKW
jgi:hypothetical protein